MASFFLDGGSNGRSMNRGGHSGGLIFGGRGQVYRHAFTGKWGGISTFASSDGNRGPGGPSRSARYWAYEQCVINGNGYPPDNSPNGAAELMKFEGRDNRIADSVFLDSLQQGMYMDSGSWSHHCSGQRLCHSVFQNFGGPIFEMRDYLDDNQPGEEPVQGLTRVHDFQIKNCIFDRMAQNEISSWTDLLVFAYMSTGVDWRNVIQMHGVTIRDSRTASQLYLEIRRGVSPPGKQTLQWYIDNHPSNFSNITVGSSSLFTSERTLGTAIMPTQIATHFTPSTTANGVSLTLANGAGVASTALVVDDAKWFRDPRYVSSDGSSPQIHLGGVGNRSYTAINYATNTITLSASATWSDNAAVNRSITSGSTPNRGAVR